MRYARAENHSAALQITFIFYSPEICMISKSRKLILKKVRRSRPASQLSYSITYVLCAGYRGYTVCGYGHPAGSESAVKGADSRKCTEPGSRARYMHLIWSSFLIDRL